MLVEGGKDAPKRFSPKEDKNGWARRTCGSLDLPNPSSKFSRLLLVMMGTFFFTCDPSIIFLIIRLSIIPNQPPPPGFASPPCHHVNFICQTTSDGSLARDGDCTPMVGGGPQPSLWKCHLLPPCMLGKKNGHLKKGSNCGEY